MKRLEVLDKVALGYKECERCALHRCRSKVVHWRGNPDARLFVVGEAPGADEDREGRPFVGPSGRMLDLVLQAAGLESAQDVFIANMVGCRPPGNRQPERDELKACAPRLQLLLRAVRPRALLLLGATAAKLATTMSVMSARGSELEAELLCYDGEVRTWPAIVTYHPAFLLRTGGQSGTAFKQSVRDAKSAWKLSRQ